MTTEIGVVGGVRYTGHRKGNSIRIEYSGKEGHTPGLGKTISSGQLCEIVALPGGNLLTRWDKPVRVFPEGEAGAEEAIRWAIAEHSK